MYDLSSGTSGAWQGAGLLPTARYLETPQMFTNQSNFLDALLARAALSKPILCCLVILDSQLFLTYLLILPTWPTRLTYSPGLPTHISTWHSHLTYQLSLPTWPTYMTCPTHMHYLSHLPTSPTYLTLYTIGIGQFRNFAMFRSINFSHHQELPERHNSQWYLLCYWGLWWGWEEWYIGLEPSV